MIVAMCCPRPLFDFMGGHEQGSLIRTKGAKCSKPPRNWPLNLFGPPLLMDFGEKRAKFGIWHSLGDGLANPKK